MLRADVGVTRLPRACAPVEELFVHQVVLERHKRDALGERLWVPVRRHCLPVGGSEPGPGLSLPVRTLNGSPIAARSALYRCSEPRPAAAGCSSSSITSR